MSKRDRYEAAAEAIIDLIERIAPPGFGDVRADDIARDAVRDTFAALADRENAGPSEIDDSAELDGALVAALNLHWERRAAGDKIPEVRVDLSYDPNETKALKSRAPHFIQAGDDSRGCHHEELLLIADEVDLTARREPVITCAKCFKRWGRPGK